MKNCKHTLPIQGTLDPGDTVITTAFDYLRNEVMITMAGDKYAVDEENKDRLFSVCDAHNGYSGGATLCYDKKMSTLKHIGTHLGQFVEGTAVKNIAKPINVSALLTTPKFAVKGTDKDTHFYSSGSKFNSDNSATFEIVI